MATNSYELIFSKVEMKKQGRDTPLKENCYQETGYPACWTLGKFLFVLFLLSQWYTITTYNNINVQIARTDAC